MANKLILKERAGHESIIIYCICRNFLDIRYSEIASEANLEQKQSHSSYMARGVPNFGCPRTHLLS